MEKGTVAILTSFSVQEQIDSSFHKFKSCETSLKYDEKAVIDVGREYASECFNVALISNDLMYLYIFLLNKLIYKKNCC